MEKSLKVYFSKLVVLSFALSAISILLFLSILKAYFLIVFPFVVLYFVVLSFINYYFISSSFKINPKMFHTNYMMGFGIKLLLHLCFILTYVLIFREDALAFVLFFFANYLAFTIFDVVSLIKKVG